jgi:hypothetical protein
MRDEYAVRDARRRSPRVGVDAVCWDEVGREGLVVDLSPEGLKIERPYLRPWMDDRIQLELELPEIDEVVWVGGEICFDRRLHRVQSTGVRVVAAAARDLRRIRDFVLERAARLRAEASYDLSLAGCYLRG